MADIISFIGTNGVWNAFSAGEKASYTDTGGANYTTVAAFESDFGNHADGDLVGTGDVVIGEINGTRNEQNVFNSWVNTDATNHITIRAESLNASGKYEHVADTGSWWGGSAYVVDNYEFITIEDIHLGAPEDTPAVFPRSASDYIINRCTIEFGTEVGDAVSGATLVYNSCLFIQNATSGGTGVTRYHTLNNCTIICTDTEGVIVRQAACENVLVYNADATTTFSNFFACTGNYNAQSVSNQAAPPGANIVDDVPTTDFNSYSTGDYTLSGTGATIYQKGTPSVTLDHDNVAFDVTTPSIGAFEFIAAGGATWPHNPLGHPFHGAFGGPIA